MSLNIIHKKIEKLKHNINIPDLSMKLSNIDELISFDPNFWKNPKNDLLKTRSDIEKLLNEISKIDNDFIALNEYLQEFPGETESFNKEIESLHDRVKVLEFRQMFKDPIDSCAAMLMISAGAGGLEAANWVTMLLRMYCRFIENNGFKAEIIEHSPSEEHSSICTDSVCIRITGDYAYGFFKNESGVHRLIRNSPFNSGDARHTSFAAVSVTADIEDKIDIKIEDKDIEVSAQTSGAKGGQNANKVSSAIRIKHLPTGICVLARTERDQLSNKKNAFKILKAKLYDIELKKKKSEEDLKISNLSDISFGSQIRTYTLSPFQLVKDHRSNFEVKNAFAVLNGEISDLIKSNL